ncbi:MAG TPA: hypothetical protein DCL21_02945 [Alphaproteobacteria bacterium]|nr:hypothetical protein [Alphaproteobacteria bacterium]
MEYLALLKLLIYLFSPIIITTLAITCIFTFTFYMLLKHIKSTAKAVALSFVSAALPLALVIITIR